MKPNGSKRSDGSRSLNEAHPGDQVTGASSVECAEQHPELSSALEAIISAFVDIGFGTSAPQQARRAANSNTPMKRVAESFHHKAA